MHEDVPEEALEDLANRALALTGVAIGLMLLAHHVEALGDVPFYLDTMMTAVGLWIHFGAGCFLLGGLLLFNWRARRGVPIQRESRALAYSLWMMAYEAHEWTHFLTAVLLDGEARRVRGPDGRPGTVVRFPAEAPEWRRVAVDVAPVVIGLPIFLYTAPWILALYTTPDGSMAARQLTIVEGTARVLIGAQLVIYSWPSLEDLRGLASLFGLVDGRREISRETSGD